MGTHPIFESDFDCLTEKMSRHDFTRDPCPWRLVEDMGGAYSMGLVGGGIWAGGKSIVRREFRYLARNVRQNAPRTAAGFAVWGFSFSLIDCSLIALRRKEDAMNAIIAGGATGAILAARQGPAASLVSGAIGAMLLGMIEAGSVMMNRFGSEMLKPAAPKMDSEAPKAFD